MWVTSALVSNARLCSEHSMGLAARERSGPTTSGNPFWTNLFLPSFAKNDAFTILHARGTAPEDEGPSSARLNYD